MCVLNCVHLMHYIDLQHMNLEKYAHWKRGWGGGGKPNVHYIKYVTYY